MKYKIEFEFGFGIGEDKNGRNIAVNDARRAVRAICDKAVTLFGGYTLLDVFGGWKNDAGRVVEEPGKTLIIYADTAYQSNGKLGIDNLVAEFAGFIKGMLEQECVAVITTQIEIEYL